MSEDLVRQFDRKGAFATYNLIDALSRNPTTIYAGADICAEAKSTILVQADRIKELEAKLAKAMEALELYSCDDGCNDCPEHERDLVTCGWTASVALAATRETRAMAEPYTDPDMLTRAEADRQTRQAVAAALMQAADLVDALSDDILDGAQACAETHPAFSEDRQEHAEDARQVAVRIRALITEDAQTALTQMLAEARKEGRREGHEASVQIALSRAAKARHRAQTTACMATAALNEESAATAEGIAAAIRAAADAIQKEGGA